MILAEVPPLTDGQQVIRSWEDPIQQTGHLQILRGTRLGRRYPFLVLSHSRSTSIDLLPPRVPATQFLPEGPDRLAMTAEESFVPRQQLGVH